MSQRREEHPFKEFNLQNIPCTLIGIFIPPKKKKISSFKGFAESYSSRVPPDLGRIWTDTAVFMCNNAARRLLNKNLDNEKVQ